MDFARVCARLDPKCFKAFMAVVAEGSFSSAAHSAAMTVSGVSQHIANIESALSAPLFVRTSSGCKLTEQGQRFHGFVKSYSNLLADLFEDLSTSQNQLFGVVRYAMPPSCILSPHFPMLLQRRLDHPGLELSVSLQPNADVLRSLQEAHIDFGFVTERVAGPSFQYQAFCQEEYVLVGPDKALMDQINADNFMHQRFVLYPGIDVYINFFLRHCFPQLQQVDARSIHHVSGRITTIEGGIMMTAGGLGISVFPRHCIQHLVDDGKLHIYEPMVSRPLLNDIFIVTHAQTPLPRRVKSVIQWFIDMHST
jgi:LysR family transcriptional regulator, transcriptional activator of the cysJI operon